MQSRPVWGAWIEIGGARSPGHRRECRAPYGARGLKFSQYAELWRYCRRAPYGARGLKYLMARSGSGTSRSRAPYGARGLKSGPGGNTLHYSRMSRPVWGAWIEISTPVSTMTDIRCRAPYGARGLKLPGWSRRIWRPSSRPVWGAWIEIGFCCVRQSLQASRAPYGARGLKLNSVGVDLEHGQSRPVWGAWIEIPPVNAWSRS